MSKADFTRWSVFRQQRQQEQQAKALANFKLNLVGLVISILCFVVFSSMVVLQTFEQQKILILLMAASLGGIVFFCRTLSPIRKGLYAVILTKFILCYAILAVYLYIHAGKYDITDWILIAVLIVIPLADFPKLRNVR